ncbi:MAG: hypothetical protein J5I93_23150 [Pirellulaceae bacterium]|nr:hypothetical protein [Pirellulaceae bacterium]
MPIEFACPSCRTTLRVPDDSAGKQARCPKCNAVIPVPGGAAAAPGEFSPPRPSPSSPSPPSSPSSEPSAGPSPAPAYPPSSTGGFPAGAGESPFGFGGGAAPYEPKPGGGAANPYAPPQPFVEKPAVQVSGGPIVGQTIDVGDVINYSWEVWKVHLGLLVGVTVFVGVVNFGLSLIVTAIQGGLEGMGGDEAQVAVALVAIFGQLVQSLVALYLGIGQTQVFLKLARGQNAEFSDVFRGGPLFMPVLGGGILYSLAVGAGFVLLIIPGFIVLILFWPYYYLIIDQKTRVFESFSVAYEITRQNVGQIILLALAGMGIVIIGLLAACVGVIFAGPLAQMLWVVGYLMMSGQLQARGRG